MPNYDIIDQQYIPSDADVRMVGGFYKIKVMPCGKEAVFRFSGTNAQGEWIKSTLTIGELDSGKINRKVHAVHNSARYR
jgi:hypothetical protein